jgi:hypothetical protein
MRIAFALQQWIPERASMLHDKYIACLVALEYVQFFFRREFFYSLTIKIKQNKNGCFMQKFTGVFGAFAKLRKVTITFVMSVRPSARMEHLGSHKMHFHEI